MLFILADHTAVNDILYYDNPGGPIYAVQFDEARALYHELMDMARDGRLRRIEVQYIEHSPFPNNGETTNILITNIGESECAPGFILKEGNTPQVCIRILDLQALWDSGSEEDGDNFERLRQTLENLNWEFIEEMPEALRAIRG